MFPQRRGSVTSTVKPEAELIHAAWWLLVRLWNQPRTIMQAFWQYSTHFKFKSMLDTSAKYVDGILSQDNPAHSDGCLPALTHPFHWACTAHVYAKFLTFSHVCFCPTAGSICLQSSLCCVYTIVFVCCVLFVKLSVILLRAFGWFFAYYSSLY